MHLWVTPTSTPSRGGGERQGVRTAFRQHQPTIWDGVTHLKPVGASSKPPKPIVEDVRWGLGVGGVGRWGEMGASLHSVAEGLGAVGHLGGARAANLQ